MTKQEYEKEAYQIIGEFLTYWITIENNITWLLSRYLCSDFNKDILFKKLFDGPVKTKTSNAFEVLLKNVRIKTRIEAYEYIVSNYLVKTIDNKKLIRRLKEIYKIRNNFAHNIVYIPKEGDYKNNILSFYTLGKFDDKGKHKIVYKYDKNKHREIMNGEMEEIIGLLQGTIRSLGLK